MIERVLLNGAVSLRLGNCMELLADMPAASVDAVITDPPYEQTSLKWDRWPSGWPQAVLRVLRPGGSMWCFGSMRMFLDKRDDFEGWRFAQDVVWEKHNGSSFLTDRFRRVHEIAAQFYPKSTPWSDVYKDVPTTPDATAKTVRRKKRPPHMGGIGGHAYVSEDGGPRLMNSVIVQPSCHGFAIHPTQKPEELLVPLIQNACPPGGVVLDPFGGSGSTGAAAARIGRRAILIEGDPSYFEKASSRLSPGPLFAELGA